MPHGYGQEHPHPPARPVGPVDLYEIDPRSTPGLRRRQEGRQGGAATLAERLATLQERLYAEGRTGGTRSVLLVLQGHGHLRQGRHHPPRRRPGRPAGRARSRRSSSRRRRSAATTSCGGSSRQLPRAGHDRRLRPLALRGRARRARARARRRRTWIAPLRRDQRLRGRARRGRHARRQVLPAHLGATSRTSGCSARLDDPTKHWKYNPARPRRARAVGRLPAAYEDALERCNTEAAPWYVVPADRKWYRNWAVTQLLLEHLAGHRPRLAAGRLRRRGRAAPGAGRFS